MVKILLMCFIGKQRALSREVTCHFRHYLKIGLTSIKPSWKHWTFTSNYRCLHTGVPYNAASGWIRQHGKAQCSLSTYSSFANEHITFKFKQIYRCNTCKSICKNERWKLFLTKIVFFIFLKVETVVKRFWTCINTWAEW